MRSRSLANGKPAKKGLTTASRLMMCLGSAGVRARFSSHFVCSSLGAEGSATRARSCALLRRIRKAGIKIEARNNL